ILSYGLRVQIGTLASAANLRLDQIMLVALVPPAALGIYVVAVKVSSISSILTPIVLTVSVPHIASRATKEAKIEQFTNIFQLYWLLTVASKLVFICILPIAVPIIYGVEFIESTNLALLLVVGSLFYDV